MADNERTLRSSKPAANRVRMQGVDGEPTDRGAGAPGQELGDRAQPRGEAEREPRAFAEPDANLDDRNAAGLDDTRGDLGASTPAGVDVHDLGQQDKPEADWGDEAEEGLAHSANHTRRGIKTEAERGQGAKTRQRTKDIISRRG